MNNLKISALRLDLYDFEGPPALELKPYRPKNLVKEAWIPQTLGDQVWVGYMFQTEKERTDWESTLPDKFKKCLDRELIPEFKHYGWKIRNANGFEI